jgi:hypothetical protein
MAKSRAVSGHWLAGRARASGGIDLANRLRMRSKPEAIPADALRGELERLGLAPDEAGPLAERLAQLYRELPAREYRALLEGVAIGQRAARAARSPELSRMLADFASELQKLDEGLRLLTAFLSRLREQTLEPARTLH